MPRYVIERNFGAITDDEMLAASVRSVDAAERFDGLVWEHSHLVTTDDGEMVTYCIYEAPSEQVIRDHADAMGPHTIANIFEIVDDVTPDEVRRRAAAAHA